MPEMLDKVRELRELKPDLDIEVDGGMDLDNIILANAAGANMFVSGSYLMLAKNVEETMNELMVYLAQN
jgi:ribulose-phosphate 3-epimerase